MDQDGKEKIVDTGLGLGDFLSKGAKPDESSPVEKQPDDKKLEARTEEKKETKPAQRVEDKPPTDAKPAESKSQDAEKVSPEFKPNWDDDNNPWKKKASEFDQRYRDTHRNWNTLNQQKQEMQLRMSILEKKIDGTYDPDVDEPKAPDPVAVRQWGTIEGKAQASYAAATRVHGEDKVMAALNKYAEVFGNDRHTQERVLMSADPVQAAMDALSGFEFFSEYGNDPRNIVETIRKKLEAELSPKIAERESQRIMAEIAKKHREPDGLGRVLGASGASDKQVSRDNAGRPKSLGDITGFGR